MIVYVLAILLLELRFSVGSIFLPLIWLLIMFDTESTMFDTESVVDGVDSKTYDARKPVPSSRSFDRNVTRKYLPSDRTVKSLSFY